ncbi:MAG: methyltransferase family protein [Stackebrandtia sp.]
MNEAVLLLVLLNFGAIGLLTVRFFRSDFQPTLKWLAAALPHFACPGLLIAAYLADLNPIAPQGWTRPLEIVAVVLSASSIALMFFTWGNHRIPLAHFHQHDDVPEHIVTHGAYQRIRHPFYASYFLLYVAAAAVFPHWGSLGILAYVIVAMNLTAAGEERRLSDSEFGDEYRRHIARTGRFMPTPVRGSAPVR